MTWNHEKQAFDPPKDWPIERDEFADLDEDGDAGAGLATALLFGGLFWGCVALWIFQPWTRAPIGAALGLVGFWVVSWWLSTRIVDRWRRDHADGGIVDWLNRNGL